MANISKNEAALNVQPKLELGHYYRMQGQTRPAHSYATQGAFDQENGISSKILCQVLKL